MPIDDGSRSSEQVAAELDALVPREPGHAVRSTRSARAHTDLMDSPTTESPISTPCPYPWDMTSVYREEIAMNEARITAERLLQLTITTPEAGVARLVLLSRHNGGRRCGLCHRQRLSGVGIDGQRYLAYEACLAIYARTWPTAYRPYEWRPLETITLQTFGISLRPLNMQNRRL